LQAWKPIAHVKPQRWFGLQDAAPFTIVGQSAATQQLDDAMQAPPQRLKPIAQVKSQAVPLHVGAPWSGTEQGSQLVPHEFGLLLDRHWPLQSCVPMGHMFMQGCVVGVHAPAHSRWPIWQSPPQVCPSQVDVPPWGGVHASQDMPQWAGSLLSTHCPPQRWKPFLHARPQLWPAVQDARPLAGVPQSAAVQQPPMGTHVASGQAL
jgi:hypothetical protein